MRRISTTEARRRFAEIVMRAAYKGQRTVLTHYGRPIAVVATVADLRKLDPTFDDQPVPAKKPARKKPG